MVNIPRFEGPRSKGGASSKGFPGSDAVPARVLLKTQPMKMLPSFAPARSGPTPPAMVVPGLEMRTIDPRKLGQALKRLCQGKLVAISEVELPLPAPVLHARPAWVR